MKEKKKKRKKQRKREEGRGEEKGRGKKGRKEKKERVGRKERSKGGEEGGKKARRLVVTRGHGELLFNGYRVLQDEKSSEDRQ